MQSLKRKEILSSTESENSDQEAIGLTAKKTTIPQSKNFQVNLKFEGSEGAKIGKRSGQLLNLTSSSEDQCRVLKNAASLADQIRSKARSQNFARRRELACQQVSNFQIGFQNDTSCASELIPVNVSLVGGTSPEITFCTLININSQLLYAQTFDAQFNALSALLDLFTPGEDSLQPFIEMFLEAGLLTPIVQLLQIDCSSMTDTQFQNFKDTAKICFSILIHLTLCSKKTLDKLFKRRVHLIVASLISTPYDTEFHSLLSVLLGNLIDNHQEMCVAVMELGCLPRMCSIIEMLPQEIELRRSVIYFIQACFKFIKLRTHLIPAVRTYLICLHNWQQLDNISLQKILACFQPLVLDSKSVLRAIAKELMVPLYQLFEKHSDSEIRLLAVRLLGDVCGLDSKDYCFSVLEAGICNQIHKLRLETLLKPNDIPTKELLKSTLFVLANIVADECPRIIEFLILNRVYEEKIIPLYLSDVPLETKVELAYCFGNLFIRADFTQIKHFVQIGVLDILVDSLGSCSDVVVTVMLTAIKKLLRKTQAHYQKADELGFQQHRVIFEEFERKGGVDRLESLQWHRNKQVFICAQSILLQNYEVDLAQSTGVRDPTLLKLFSELQTKRPKVKDSSLQAVQLLDPNKKVDIRNPEAIRQLFDELDRETDPFGENAFKKLDLKVRGPICYEKGYSNVKDAERALEMSQSQINKILNSAREHQIQSFNVGANEMIRKDMAIAEMPIIRINANILMSQKRLEESIRANQKQKLRNVDVHAFIRRANASQKPKPSMAPSGLFEPASSRHKFNKDTSEIRMFFKTIADVESKKLNTTLSTFRPNPLAVTTGAEFYKEQPVVGKMNLVKNTPNNVQLLRLNHLDLKQATNNSKFEKLESLFTPKRFSQPPISPEFFQTSAFRETSMMSTYSTLRLAHQSSPRQKTHDRPEPKLIFCSKNMKKPNDSEFTAKPADDIPRNGLVEKLTRGIQNFVHRMQKREGFRVKVTIQPQTIGCIPAPRECGTLTNNAFGSYLIGGLCSETISEVSVAVIDSGVVSWQKVEINDPHQQIRPRQCHTTVAFKNKLFVFGGCFDFNRKRQVRETTNQVIEIDPIERTASIHKTVGMAFNVRKNHTAVTYKSSMVIFGGTSENGFVYQDMLSYKFDSKEMITIQLIGGQAPEYFYQGAACAVIKPKGGFPLETHRKSDEIKEGIYYFGGRAANGELIENKIRYFKPKTIDHVVVSGEFQNIKASGQPPCPRSNHSMSYLPVSKSVLICGGRNDAFFKTNYTSYLNDIYLFLLDQKVWIKVKYSFDSDHLDYFCNHSATVVTDFYRQEQIIIFGGITNKVIQEPVQSNSEPKIQSALTNKCYLLEIKQRPSAQNIIGRRESSQFA